MDFPGSYKKCPSCSADHPVYQDELSWCPHCEWNIDGDVDTNQKQGTFERLHRDLGKKLTQQLFEEFQERQFDRPRMSWGKVLTYVFATLVHLSTLMIPVIILLAFKYCHVAFAVFIAVPLALLLWSVLPKPSKKPTDIVPRESYPLLHETLDEIAFKMGTSTPTMVQITSEYNAFYTEYGVGPWKKKLISLGLPLLSQLSDEEIIAIMSHETSHGANGDVARGAYVGSALSALANWYYALRPQSISEGMAYICGGPVMIWLSNISAWVASHIPLAGYSILLRLLFRQKQEAEYLADRLAAEVCGSEAMVSALSKLERDSSWSMAVQRVALAKESKGDVFALANEFAEKPVSSHEKERRRRLMIREGLSFDATHPPTPYRISFISKVSYLPQVKLSAEQSRKLRAELNGLKEKVSRDLIDRYLNSLYYGS